MTPFHFKNVWVLFNKPILQTSKVTFKLTLKIFREQIESISKEDKITTYWFFLINRFFKDSKNTFNYEYVYSIININVSKKKLNDH
jgi:hypothetical protein